MRLANALLVCDKYGLFLQLGRYSTRKSETSLNYFGLKTPFLRSLHAILVL